MKLYDQLSDNELVSLSLKERDVFAVLIERYYKKIYRYIKRISSFSDDHVNDIIQNTFIKVYINLNSYDSSFNFSSWVYRIAHNETISFLRTNKKHIEATLLPDDSLQEFMADVDLEKEHIGKEDSQLLWDAIHSLKQEYQNVLVLKYFEHKSYDEISDIIQKPPGTVATWINRAKKEIHNYLLRNNYIKHE